MSGPLCLELKCSECCRGWGEGVTPEIGVKTMVDECERLDDDGQCVHYEWRPHACRAMN